ncbi:hypothetical protein HRTV-25_gp106 [Halorubrum tailed virus 25]|uniref:Uncharacterized protein n=1 Tax=Halorubrum tailed virus 25 TaxID=2878006 RepID=A0AAE8XYW0_9CAUD|nr:hypothetical protein M1M37_gp106 [Halorubrum tailed virus 25]UBF22687.1 hypothetical protein HRTV-25_gp106 [Halorubrum tailed virus 25]
MLDFPPGSTPGLGIPTRGFDSMKWQEQDEDSKEESTPDKWAQQRRKQQEVGDEITRRKEGETMNGLFE